MLFNSFEFCLFFPAVTILFFCLPQRYRWAHLLLASACFYMAFIPAYLLILIFLVLLDYSAGLLIERSVGARRRRFLILSLVSNILTLGVFKYFNFFISTFGNLTRLWGQAASFPMLDIVLPIGLSFHTFQSMSYTIEVYRGNQKAERHLGIYALYVMFYPQLVAGPIERPQNLLHQFHQRHEFDEGAFVAGLRLMLLGFFKKLVVADRLALFVNAVYGAPRSFPGPILLLATLFFSLQIYADFSGYSDIAVGAAKAMGFDLMTNFRRPYLSSSVSEFWTRWHISLSTWFRDYVYIPLGGSRVSRARWQTNLLVTFVISGFWHGANWTFLAWGALNGFYLILPNLPGIPSWPIRKPFRIPVTFLLISASWIFFRAPTLSDALFIFKRILADARSFLHPQAVLDQAVAAAGSPQGLSRAFIAIGALVFVDVILELQESGSLKRIGERPVWVRWPVYYAGLTAILLLGVFNLQKFIYFQF